MFKRIYLFSGMCTAIFTQFYLFCCPAGRFEHVRGDVGRAMVSCRKPHQPTAGLCLRVPRPRYNGQQLICCVILHYIETNAIKCFQYRFFIPHVFFYHHRTENDGVFGHVLCHIRHLSSVWVLPVSQLSWAFLLPEFLNTSRTQRYASTGDGANSDSLANTIEFKGRIINGKVQWENSTGRAHTIWQCLIYGKRLLSKLDNNDNTRAKKNCSISPTDLFDITSSYLSRGHLLDVCIILNFCCETNSRLIIYFIYQPHIA